MAERLTACASKTRFDRILNITSTIQQRLRSANNCAASTSPVFFRDPLQPPSAGYQVDDDRSDVGPKTSRMLKIDLYLSFWCNSAPCPPYGLLEL
jgi:hypothetical protein